MFGGGDANTLQLGMDAQIWNNAPSPDIRQLQPKANQHHFHLVEDKLCKNLGEVFQSQIFKTILERVIYAKSKENTLPENMDNALSIKNTANRLHNKQDIFDGISVSPVEINNLSQFLHSLSESDMTHIIDIYNKIAPKSGKRKNQATMEAFVALTHPAELKKTLEEEIGNKKQLNLTREYSDYYMQVQNYLSFLNKSDHNLQEKSQYHGRTKEKLSTTKLGDHKIEIFNMIVPGQQRIAYLMANKDPQTLQPIGRNIKSARSTSTKNALIVHTCNESDNRERQIFTLDGRKYEFGELYKYTQGTEGLQYIGLPSYQQKRTYFDKDFNELEPKIINHERQNGRNFNNIPCVHHHITIKEKDGKEIKFTIIHWTNSNFMSPSSEKNFESIV